ncbi:MAG: nucleotidyltransferase domain-containing protein [Chloroflexota bacterium]|nr:nucleotidyltransferase domain-containing protein [Chloroflexota bacterium]
MTLKSADVPSIDEIRTTFEPFLRKGKAKRAIVFGSYARGQADRHSDLDLIIVADTSADWFDRYSAFPGVYNIWRGGIDMLIYTPKELEEMLASRRAFIEDALQEGVTIYEE